MIITPTQQRVIEQLKKGWKLSFDEYCGYIIFKNGITNKVNNRTIEILLENKIISRTCETSKHFKLIEKCHTLQP